MAGAILSSGALLAGLQGASAATTGVGPRFYSTAGIQPIRSAGSETTFYMMAALGNLYTQSSIYGCVLSSTDNRTCTQNDGSATDTLDDWSRNEYINGAGIGSGGGIGELCGSKPSGGLSVDFARSSRALGSSDFAGSCTASNLIPENYADDAVSPVDFQGVGITAIGGTPVCTAALISAGDLINGTCQLGPLAAGWEPGNPLAGPYTGTPFNNITTVGGTTSLAERIYQCAGASAITDWGQLTNGTVGSGTSIGVPIYIPFVNTASGTYSTWKGVVGCDTNGANHDAQTAQENDAPQMADLGHGAATTLHKRWPDFSTAGTDPLLTGGSTADQVFTSNEVAASLYYVSFGVANWKPFTASVQIPNPCTGSGCVNKSSANLMSVDNVSNSPACDYNSGACTDNNGNPVTQSNSARKLFNMVRTDTLRGSVAGFLNYICDAEDPNAATQYGTDLTNGKNYANEVVSLVGTTFVFPYQPCTVDSSGNSTPPFVGPGLTPPTGGAAIASANLGT